MKSSRLRRSKCAAYVAAMAAAISMTSLPHTAIAKSKGIWSAVRTEDPITGRKSCAVSALDRIGGMRFAQIGILYAVVENNPDAGLLIGVSSGGRYRMPVGDIVWRVDDKPYRTLRAIDNPGATHTAASDTHPEGDGAAVAGGNSSAPASPSDAAAAAYSKTLAATMQSQTEMVTALTATATMASGEKARGMLEEMLGGTSLLFRQQAAAPLYGLPSSNIYAVGQETLKGRKPIPIDQSFRDGLVACGILPQ